MKRDCLDFVFRARTWRYNCELALYEQKDKNPILTRTESDVGKRGGAGAGKWHAGTFTRLYTRTKIREKGHISSLLREFKGVLLASKYVQLYFNYAN